MRAKKSLGQHFLTSRNALKDIVKAADIQKTDIVLEIGPGRGALTATLLQEAKKVVAIEKDDELVPYLREIFAKEIHSGTFVLIHADILDVPLERIAQETGPNYKLVANIPYYITGALLRLFLSHTHIPQKMVLMLQKEVAQRIVARNHKESLLSLSVKAYGVPRYIKTISRIHFSPQPQVDSAILLIDTISKNFFDAVSEENFFTLIKAGFAHKRKIMSRNIESVYKKEMIKKAFAMCGLDLSLRAEDIALSEWKCLGQHLSSHKNAQG